jgi:twinkle protein
MDIRQYLHGKSFQWNEIKRPSGINAVMNCPFCKDTEKKFAINLDSGAFKCLHENKCGVTGSFWDFQKRLGDKPQYKDNSRLILPANKPEYKPIQVKAKGMSNEAVHYLNSRGFKNEIIKLFRLGVTDGNDAIMYPFFKNGVVVNVKYRSMKEKKFWNEAGGEPVLFNRDVCADSEILNITEGQDDCIALKHYDIDAVSVPGGTGDMRWIEHEWEYLESFKQINLIFDNDQAGQDAVDAIVKRLGNWRCYQILLPEKDVNECLMKGIPAETIYHCMTEPRGYEHSHVRNATAFADAIVEHSLDDKRLYGIKTGFSNLDNILKGWRKKELTVWTGSPGSGKSTFLNQVVLNLLDKGEKVITASMEMSPKNYLRWAVMQHCKKEFPTEEDIRMSIKNFGKNWYVLNVSGEIGEDLLIDAFTFSVRKYDIRHFFVDSLMRVCLNDRDEYKAQREFCNRLVNFAHEYDCHVHLVAHPRKGASDSDMTDRVDISGTAHITNVAHNVLVMYRLSESQRKSNEGIENKLTVKKNREFGLMDDIAMTFNQASKCFSECEKKEIKNPGYYHD